MAPVPIAKPGDWWLSAGTYILRKGSGVVTGADLIEGSRMVPDLLARYNRVNHALVDFTEVSRFEVSTREINELSVHDKKFQELLPSLFMAIVAPEDMEFGMSRMYELLTTVPGWTVQVFRTLDEAIAWLASAVPDLKTDLD